MIQDFAGPLEIMIYIRILQKSANANIYRKILPLTLKNYSF